MRLHRPHSAVLSAVIFNALVIVALIPLALRGVQVPGRQRGRDPATQRLHLRRGRHHRAVHRHQADRPDPDRTEGLLMITHLRRSIVLALFCLVFFGLIYPFVGTGVSQVLFKHQADGSITANGSTLIGQNWTSPKFFHGRPDDFGPYAGDG